MKDGVSPKPLNSNEWGIQNKLAERRREVNICKCPSYQELSVYKIANNVFFIKQQLVPVF